MRLSIWLRCPTRSLPRRRAPQGEIRACIPHPQRHEHTDAAGIGLDGCAHGMPWPAVIASRGGERADGIDSYVVRHSGVELDARAGDTPQFHLHRSREDVAGDGDADELGDGEAREAGGGAVELGVSGGDVAPAHSLAAGASHVGVVVPIPRGGERQARDESPTGGDNLGWPRA